MSRLETMRRFELPGYEYDRRAEGVDFHDIAGREKE